MRIYTCADLQATRIYTYRGKTTTRIYTYREKTPTRKNPCADLQATRKKLCADLQATRFYTYRGKTPARFGIYTDFHEGHIFLRAPYQVFFKRAFGTVLRSNFYFSIEIRVICQHCDLSYFLKVYIDSAANHSLLEPQI